MPTHCLRGKTLVMKRLCWKPYRAIACARRSGYKKFIVMSLLSESNCFGLSSVNGSHIPSSFVQYNYKLSFLLISFTAILFQFSQNKRFKARMQDLKKSRVHLKFRLFFFHLFSFSFCLSSLLS